MNYKEKIIALLNSQELSKEQKEKLESIFPELKESEDERIRKELIFYFQEEIPQCSIQEHADKMKEFISWLKRREVERTKLELKAGNSYFCYKSRWERADSETFKKGLIYKCNKNGVLDNFVIKNPEQHFIEIKDERIAWLEKQGAKVSAIEGFESEFERQVSGLIASAINKEHEYNQGYVKWTANALLNYAKHELEKQDEQKQDINIQINPSEYINDMGGNGCYLKNTTQNPSTYFYCKYGGTIPKCSDCKRNHLNSKYETKEIKTWMTPTSRGTKQCSDYIQQNSAEWSEEDENAIQVLKDIVKHSNEINENIYTVPLKEKLYDWLKFLKDRVQPQPKQEWSEGDKVMLDDIIDFFENGTVKLQHDLSLYASWLKSLKERYTWKPSDEQMERLKGTINSLPHQEVLYSLYQDLKKLMEK